MTQSVHRNRPLSPLAITIQRYSNSFQKILLAKWLGKELNRSTFHGLHRHWNVAMARNKNDWNIDLNFGQLDLKIEPVQSRESDIQYEATHPPR